MSARAGYKARLLLGGTPTAFPTNAMSVVAGTSNQVWEINDLARSVFSPKATFTVEVSENSGTSWQTLAAGEFALNYLLGRVDIDNYTTNSGVVANITNVRIAGDYLPTYTATYARSADFEPIRNLADASRFEDEGMRRESVRLDVTVSFEQLAEGVLPIDGVGGTEEAIYEMILNASAAMVELRQDGSDDGTFLRAFVLIERDAISIPGDDLLVGTIDMQGSIRETAMSSQTCQPFAYRAA